MEGVTLRVVSFFFQNNLRQTTCHLSHLYKKKKLRIQSCKPICRILMIIRGQSNTVHSQYFLKIIGSIFQYFSILKLFVSDMH